MEVQLSPEALAVINEQVASGEFASAAEVVDEALALLQERDRHYGEWLRAEVQKGEDSLNAGHYRVVDDAFWAEVRARYTS